MSNFLAVDTSSRYLTVAACKDGKVTVNYLDGCAMRHSVLLMDEIEKTLKRADMALSECDYFAAVTGPGSFTGIRIGISCVKGFASALQKKAVGVTSFDMLSYNVNSDCPYMVAIDAAHGHYYICGYTQSGVCDIEARYASEAEVLSYNRHIYGFEELPFGNYSRLSAGDCLANAVIRQGECGDIAALYVRKSQAEEERCARMGENGNT